MILDYYFYLISKNVIQFTFNVTSKRWFDSMRINFYWPPSDLIIEDKLSQNILSPFYIYPSSVNDSMPTTLIDYDNYLYYFLSSIRTFDHYYKAIRSKGRFYAIFFLKSKKIFTIILIHKYII